MPNRSAIQDHVIQQYIYDFVLYRDTKTGAPAPGLGDRWGVSPDGKAYTLYLHPGVQFHDGWGEMTAEDVKFTIELVSKEGSINGRAPYFRDTIASMEVVNPYQLIIRTKNPAFDVPYSLTNYVPYLPIVSKKYVETVGEAQASARPIGTGSWKFVEHKKGEYVKLEAVENHWRQTPYYKTLMVRNVPEDATRIAMLKTGQADIIELPLPLKEEVTKAGFRTQALVGASNIFISLPQYLPTRESYDPKVAWVDGDNPERALKVRKALNLAVNRQEIISYVLMGEGEPLAVPYFFPGMVFTDPAWKPYPFDPAQAKKLLAEAGYSTGFSMTLLVYTMPGRPELPKVGEAIAMQWEQNLGIKVKLEMTEWALLRPKTAARSLPPWTAFIYANPFWDEPIMLGTVLMHSKATLGFIMESAEMDKLVGSTMVIMDFEQRKAEQKKIGQKYYDEYRAVPIAIKNTIFGISDKVGEWPMAPFTLYPHYLEYIKPKK